MHKKLYYSILTILVVLLIGFAYLTFHKTSAPPISYQTPATSVQYKNTDYGFTFDLPDSWSGYTIVSSTWQGSSLDANGQNQNSETGPFISIRHPAWTASVPRQDIPIMVFTLQQWSDMQADKFHIGAAPIGPSELGRNSTYVFGLPARYNFAFPVGFEEVQQLIDSGSFKTF
jgi:hypothetical protein